MLLEAIILYCLKQIDRERTINSIYHLLLGKPSIQTIQDAHLYGLERFYALYKTLDKRSFAEQVKQLNENSYIEHVSHEHFVVTVKGKTMLEKFDLAKYYWNGMKFHQIDSAFFERLLLFIQVWTNAKNHNFRYIPIVENPKTLHWAKRLFHREPKNYDVRLKQLYKELVRIFDKLPPIYPEMFIRQITTAEKIGLTFEQLANALKKPVSDIRLLHMNYVHFMLEELSAYPKQYPLLTSFVQGLNDATNETTLTNSANITLSYIKRGFPLAEIAKRRKLKLNTIYDHIVEIALHDDNFPIEPFVSLEKQDEIFKAAEKLKTRKLKLIKEAVGEDIDYFQIRLALTKRHRSNGEKR